MKGIDVLVMGRRVRRKSCVATPRMLASSFLGGMGAVPVGCVVFFFFAVCSMSDVRCELESLSQVKRGVQTAPGTAQRAGPCGQWTVDSGVWLDRLTGNVPWFNNV